LERVNTNQDFQFLIDLESDEAIFGRILEMLPKNLASFGKIIG